MLNSRQRAALRKAANGLSPVYQIGKGGLDAPLVEGAAACIAKRELIKLRLLESCPEDPREAAEHLAGEIGAEVVQVVGRVMVLFRKKKKESAFEDILK